MAELLKALHDEHVDDGTSLISCVCACCAPLSLLALTRCSKWLRQAVTAPLQQAEQQSAAKVSEHIGATIEELAVENIVAWRSGLPLAQCWHLGTWLQPGGLLEGVATLRLQEEDGRVIRVDLAPLRSGETRCNLNHSKLDAESMTVLARLIAVNGALTDLNLCDNKIGDQGATAVAEALKVNGALTNLNLFINKIGDQGATAIAKALEVNGALTALNLFSNQIGDQGATAIADALKVNGALKTLELDGNSIGPSGATAIAEALKVNGALKLKELWVGSTNATLKAACAEKGVTLY